MNILASVHPQYCELIAGRKKQVEIRKTKPKLKTPFKCYIYQTKKTWFYNSWIFKNRLCQGKVIGEFICDEIYTFEYENGGFLVNGDIATTQDVRAMSCLSDYEFRRYAGEKTVYGWHISDLVIYDVPKGLEDFVKVCPWYEKCWKCRYHNNGNFDEPPSCEWDDFELTRPPQSWCYVAEFV